MNRNIDLEVQRQQEEANLWYDIRMRSYNTLDKNAMLFVHEKVWQVMHGLHLHN